MERADKIFVIMSAAGLIALLVWRRCAPTIPARLDVSTVPNGNWRGPAYLVANNPVRRVRDDYEPRGSL